MYNYLLNTRIHCKQVDYLIIMATVDPAIFENPPSRERGNFILFSAHERRGIEGLLQAFPRKQTVLPKAVSSTVLWSGVTGCNTPIRLFAYIKIGIVLNPYLTYVPQADVHADGSYGEVVQEVLQADANPVSSLPYEQRVRTKSANKIGYLRKPWVFTINYARYSHRRTTYPIQPDHYADIGSASIFAKYIWRKWYNPKKLKRGDALPSDHGKYPMSLNEAITFQKGEVNPIAGLFISNESSQTDIDTIIAILKSGCWVVLF